MNYVNIICEFPLMQSMGDRLRSARESAKFTSASSAAKRFGWKISTYIAHENGQNDYDNDAAKRYAKAFKVSPSWLLLGEGSPKAGAPRIESVVNYVDAGGNIIRMDDHSIGDGIEEVELPAGVPPNVTAVKVKGNSMHPRYYDGEYLFYVRDGRSPTELVGRECVVALSDGRIMVKTLQRGSRKGLFRLESFNAPTIEDVRVEWAGYVWRPGVAA